MSCTQSQTSIDENLVKVQIAEIGHVSLIIQTLVLSCLAVEAIHIANLLCQHGYFFPVGDNRNLSVKDDSSLYRFQVNRQRHVYTSAVFQ